MKLSFRFALGILFVIGGAFPAMAGSAGYWPGHAAVAWSSCGR
jgi:hypothetical protein